MDHAWLTYFRGARCSNDLRDSWLSLGIWFAPSGVILASTFCHEIFFHSSRIPYCLYLKAYPGVYPTRSFDVQALDTLLNLTTIWRSLWKNTDVNLTSKMNAVLVLILWYLLLYVEHHTKL